MSDIQPIWDPRVPYTGKIVQIVHQDMQKWEKVMTYERAERAPGVRLIIVDDHNNICLTREHRTELNIGKWWYDYRLPWGKVIDTLQEYNAFRDIGGDILETARQAAIREAKEEVWVTWNNISLLHRSGCGSTMVWDLYYFKIADVQIWDQELDGMEHIERHRFTPIEVREKCLDGSIQEDRSAAVLLRYLQ